MVLRNGKHFYSETEIKKLSVRRGNQSKSKSKAVGKIRALSEKPRVTVQCLDVQNVIDNALK